MMDLSKELYNLLSSGHTSEEIAESLTDALNAAQKRVTEEQEAKRKEEEARAAAEAEKTALLDRKRERMSDILGLYAAYLDEFYPALGEQVKNDELNAMTDSIIALIDRLASLGEAFGNVELNSEKNGNKVSVKFRFDEPTEEKKLDDFWRPFYHWF